MCNASYIICAVQFSYFEFTNMNFVTYITLCHLSQFLTEKKHRISNHKVVPEDSLISQLSKKVLTIKFTTPNIAQRLHDHLCILALFRQQAAKEMEKCSEHLFYPIILNHEQTWLAYVDCCWTMGNLRPLKWLLGSKNAIYCRVIYLTHETS